MKSLKEKIEIMSAAADGKLIEAKSNFAENGFFYYPDWALAREGKGKDFYWNWYLYDYQVAPEPAPKLIDFSTLPPVFWIQHKDWTKISWNLVIVF